MTLPALPPGQPERQLRVRQHGKGPLWGGDGPARPVLTGLGAREWLLIAGALALIASGCASIVLAVASNIDAVNTRRTWVESGAAQRADQAVSQSPPIWLPDGAAPEAVATTAAAPAMATFNPIVPIANSGGVDLVEARFGFLEPPQPGAHARLWLTLHARGTRTNQPIVIAIPLEWFDSYRLEGTIPAAELDRSSTTSGLRRLIFPAMSAGPTTVVQIDVSSTSESIAAPSVRVELGLAGDAVAEAHPRTFAPKPRPGPVSAVRIPRLGIQAAVVPTDWEPPPFVVGQVRASANVTQGNTVLVGHLSGGAGSVFERLDQLVPGDTIVAVSRGLEYSFVVSDTQTLPADDSQPAAPDLRPRLTLMTCTGTWDPVARNYSDRVWVTAEPPELAAATIAANAMRPPTPVPVRADATSVAESVDSSQAADQSEPGPGGEDVPARAELGSGNGLGSTRASFDAAFGPPVGETPAKLVVYRKGAAEYHVAFTPDPPRARLITVDSVGSSASLSLPTAVVRAHALFPADALPLTRGPEAAGNVVVERVASASLATVLGQTPANGPPGNFLSAYARGASGTVSHVVVGVGDNVDALLQEASR